MKQFRVTQSSVSHYVFTTATTATATATHTHTCTGLTCVVCVCTDTRHTRVGPRNCIQKAGISSLTHSLTHGVMVIYHTGCLGKHRSTHDDVGLPNRCTFQ